MIPQLLAAAISLTPLFTTPPAYQVLEPGITAYRTTITVPAYLEQGTSTDYAWVMANSVAEGLFTQIGVAWWTLDAGPSYANLGPRIFAYTATPAQAAEPGGGTWSLGPDVYPGQKPAFQIVRVGSKYEDQYNTGSGWQTLMTANITQLVYWQTFNESYGQITPVCFTNRGSYSGTWSHIASGCGQ